MSAAAQIIERPIDGKTVIQLPMAPFTEKEFFEFCLSNKELRIERHATGKITIMAPTSTSTGGKNANLTIELGIWNKQNKLGKVFDSSTGFTLPNGAVRSPDLSWISQERWNAIEKEAQDRFAPICPDFVVELLSSSDSLSQLREKMTEYIENGCRLAWLVDSVKGQTFAYHEDGSVDLIPFDQKLLGGQVLPGFELLMGEIMG